jgi:hypothetical protein
MPLIPTELIRSEVHSGVERGKRKIQIGMQSDKLSGMKGLYVNKVITEKKCSQTALYNLKREISGTQNRK